MRRLWAITEELKMEKLGLLTHWEKENRRKLKHSELRWKIVVMQFIEFIRKNEERLAM